MSVISTSQITKAHHTITPDTMINLFSILDEAIDDMERGNVQTLEEAWIDIDAV